MVIKPWFKIITNYFEHVRLLIAMPQMTSYVDVLLRHCQTSRQLTMSTATGRLSSTRRCVSQPTNLASTGVA